MDGKIFDLEEQRSSRLAAGVDQIFNDFVLAVNGDGSATGETCHIDTMAHTEEAEIYAPVDHALAIEACPDSGGAHQIDAALFKDTGANALDDVILAFAFENHGVDSVEMEQLCEQQTRGSGSDDTYLGVHVQFEFVAASGPDSSTYQTADSGGRAPSPAPTVAKTPCLLSTWKFTLNVSL